MNGKKASNYIIKASNPSILRAARLNKIYMLVRLVRLKRKRDKACTVDRDMR